MTEILEEKRLPSFFGLSPPEDVWREIVKRMDLQTMGSVHLTCRFFHNYIKNWWDNDSYITILNTKKNEIVEGNVDERYTYHTLTSGTIIYIIDNKIVPWNIDITTVGLIIKRKLLTKITSYLYFLHILNEMTNHSYREDKDFSFTNNLEEDVNDYVKIRVSNDVASWILSVTSVAEVMKGVRQCYFSLPFPSGAQHIYLEDISETLKNVASTIRKKHPKFQMCVISRTTLHFSLDGLTPYLY